MTMKRLARKPKTDEIKRTPRIEEVSDYFIKNEVSRPLLQADGRRDTQWYDELCELWQRTQIPELRNVLWEQVKHFIYGRIHEFIRDRKSSSIKQDPDLIQELFQGSWLIFLKAATIWDKRRKTKFLTFLGNCLNQEIMNIIRLYYYHKTRTIKLAAKMKVALESEHSDSITFADELEKETMLEGVRDMMEGFPFSNELERDIARTMMYNKVGDWSRLQKQCGIGIGAFYKLRREVTAKLRKHIEDNASPKMAALIREYLEEK